MTTVVQSTYGQFIRSALEGMIADQGAWDAITRQVEDSAGVGFGVAVSHGTGDKGIVKGGSAFLGITVRDITLTGAPVDPLSDTLNAVDKYPQRSNAGVLTRGRIWVRVHGAGSGGVRAGDPLYYDTTAGTFGNSGSGQAASGSITFTIQPLANDTITVNGANLTFKASGATGDQANIGDTVAETVANAVAALQASTTTAIALMNFAVSNDDPNKLLVAADAVGTAANAYTLAASSAGATASGTTLAGGTAAATAISGAQWFTSGVAGQLAVVSLGIQH